jgi:meso-butanediol dehydrogenase / (S,S)-butanediol dehydrogenase / diacetyl reductase
VNVTGRFEGKVALVTGAGSGIGRAIALRFTGEGGSVFAVDIDGERLDRTRESAAGTFVTQHADLADEDASPSVVAACVERFGRLDVLGNIAGIYIAEHTPKMTREQYRRLMAVNLDAYFFLAQAAIPHLLDTGGSIVNIASNAGLQGVPYSAAYCMSKGGVIQLTRSLAVEYLKTSLRVNAIAPAGTNTGIPATISFPDDIDPDLARRMAGHRGMAEPEEIAAVFAFLVSDEARSVTGAVYTVDNGLTAS